MQSKGKASYIRMLSIAATHWLFSLPRSPGAVRHRKEPILIWDSESAYLKFPRDSKKKSSRLLEQHAHPVPIVECRASRNPFIQCFFRTLVICARPSFPCSTFRFPLPLRSHSPFPTPLIKSGNIQHWTTRHFSLRDCASWTGSTPPISMEGNHTHCNIL